MTTAHTEDVRFRRIIENSQAIIFVIDKQGRFLLSEGKSLSILGLKPGEVVGRSALEMYEDYPAIIRGIRKALAGRTYRGVVGIRGVTGEVDFDILCSPLCDKKGRVEALIVMAVDVTKRVKVEREARERMEELEKLNKFMMGREVKMAEMKKELAKLKIKR